MATVTQTRYTPADLLEITDRPMPELIDGQLVEREPMGQKSDAVAANVLITVGLFVNERKLGLVNGSQGSFQIFPDEPGKVRIPDVSFTSRERMPHGSEEDGHGRVPPDLAVEVISPHDRVVDVAIKVREFLGAGVRLIWVVNPYTLDVQVFRPDGTVTIRKQEDLLDGEDVLPGFECPVARLFEIGS